MLICLLVRLVFLKYQGILGNESCTFEYSQPLNLLVVSTQTSNLSNNSQTLLERSHWFVFYWKYGICFSAQISQSISLLISLKTAITQNPTHPTYGHLTSHLNFYSSFKSIVISKGLTLTFVIFSMADLRVCKDWLSLSAPVNNILLIH